jgi:hypothetical protein
MKGAQSHGFELIKVAEVLPGGELGRLHRVPAPEPPQLFALSARCRRLLRALSGLGAQREENQLALVFAGSLLLICTAPQIPSGHFELSASRPPPPSYTCTATTHPKPCTTAVQDLWPLVPPEAE